MATQRLVPYFDAELIERARAKATAWTRKQARRFGVSGGDILAAVRRGWLPDQIEELPTAQGEKLEGRPPLDPEIAEVIAKIRQAQVAPIRIESPSRAA